MVDIEEGLSEQGGDDQPPTSQEQHAAAGLEAGPIVLVQKLVAESVEQAPVAESVEQALADADVPPTPSRAVAAPAPGAEDTVQCSLGLDEQIVPAVSGQGSGAVVAPVAVEDIDQAIDDMFGRLSKRPRTTSRQLARHETEDSSGQMFDDMSDGECDDSECDALSEELRNNVCDGGAAWDAIGEDV